MSNLTFGASISLAAFKAAQGENVKIIKNPKTGKVFFSCGGETGAVAQKTIDNGFKGDLRVVKASDGQEEFLLLCNESVGNVITTL